MNRRKYLRVIFISITMFWIITSCLPPTSDNPSIERNFRIEDLIIDTSAFPENWSQESTIQEWPYEAVPASVKENRYVQFKSIDARATHSIYQFADEKAAEKGFSYPWFYDADRISPWETPVWLDYDSNISKQFRFACADFKGGYPVEMSRECIAIGQYDEFISEFSIWMIPPDRLIKEKSVLLQALNAIDKRLGRYISK